MTELEKVLLTAVALVLCFAAGFLSTCTSGRRRETDKKYREGIVEASHTAQTETFTRAKQLFTSLVDSLTAENGSQDERQVELIKLAIHKLADFVARAEANGLTHDDAVLASIGASLTRTELAIELWEATH